MPASFVNRFKDVSSVARFKIRQARACCATSTIPTTNTTIIIIVIVIIR